MLIQFLCITHEDKSHAVPIIAPWCQCHTIIAGTTWNKISYQSDNICILAKLAKALWTCFYFNYFILFFTILHCHIHVSITWIIVPLSFTSLSQFVSQYVLNPSFLSSVFNLGIVSYPVCHHSLWYWHTLSVAVFPYAGHFKWRMHSLGQLVFGKYQYLQLHISVWRHCS